MGLRDVAQSDLGKIMGDQTTGFGWPIKVVSPDGVTVRMVGYSNDVAQIIDPDTGQAISGRIASVALPLDQFGPAGVDLPQGIADAARKPWLVTFDDILGFEYTFKVAKTNPDRALGLVTCLLEAYKT